MPTKAVCKAYTLRALRLVHSTVTDRRFRFGLNDHSAMRGAPSAGCFSTSGSGSVQKNSHVRQQVLEEVLPDAVQLQHNPRILLAELEKGLLRRVERGK
jgi:hypothetical protein